MSAATQGKLHEDIFSKREIGFSKPADHRTSYSFEKSYYITQISAGIKGPLKTVYERYHERGSRVCSLVQTKMGDNYGRKHFLLVCSVCMAEIHCSDSSGNTETD